MARQAAYLYSQNICSSMIPGTDSGCTSLQTGSRQLQITRSVLGFGHWRLSLIGDKARKLQFATIINEAGMDLYFSCPLSRAPRIVMGDEWSGQRFVFHMHLVTRKRLVSTRPGTHLRLFDRLTQCRRSFWLWIVAFMMRINAIWEIILSTKTYSSKAGPVA